MVFYWSKNAIIVVENEREIFRMTRTVLITGATSGIGEAIAHAFAQNRDKLVLTGRREERLSAVKADLEKAYQATVWTYPMDVTKIDQVTEV